MQQACLVQRRYSVDQLVDPTFGQARHACDSRQDGDAYAQRQKPRRPRPVFRLQALKEVFGPRHDEVEHPGTGAVATAILALQLQFFSCEMG